MDRAISVMSLHCSASDNKEEEADSKILELARAGFSSAVLYSFTDN
jgi:hypothetical protein